MNDQEIILKQKELASKHFEYKEDLKKNLILGQLSFLNAGKILKTIKEEQTYLSEDPHLNISFNKFIETTDIPIPGESKGSRVRVAQMLMRVYEFFVEQNIGDCSKESLGEIGYSKLNLIIPPISSDYETAGEWIEKAKALSYRDLKEEINNKGLAEQFECKHTNVTQVTFWKCGDCGAIFHEDPVQHNCEDTNEDNSEQ